MYEFQIIIPHYGIDHLTRYCIRCLESIGDCSKNYQLIFVDNASPEFDSVYPELQKHPNITIRNTQNLGFIKAVNQGLKMATAPYIIFLNNDTEVVKDWLPILCQPLLDGVADISGPLSSAIDSWQGRHSVQPGYRILPKNNMLAFFCTMFKKEVFETVGYLDEDFGVGFGDDDMFCHKATQARFKLALCTSIKIKHHHRSTFKKLYQDNVINDMQNKALRLYFAKKDGLVR